MTLEEELNTAVKSMKPPTLSLDAIARLIDFTLLNEHASAEQLDAFQSKVSRFPIAAVCLYPIHLKQIQTPHTVKRATVLNFPNGEGNTAAVLNELELALQSGPIDEIDTVFPYSLYLNGEKKAALQQCQQLYAACIHHGLTFKVILETGAFTDFNELYTLCRQIIQQGCHFLKTSTGKIATGATPIAAFTILKAIQTEATKTGIKVSGGIRTLDDARFYIALAEHCLKQTADPSWFRIGASSLLDYCH